MLVVIVAWWAWSLYRWQYVENRDPKDVFEHVFHVAPTPGVREIRAAGHQPFDGNFWLLIRTDDIDGLLQAVGAKEQVTDRSSLWLFEPTTPELRRFAASVSWESSHHVKKPEHYAYMQNSGTSWWMVVDRTKKIVYVGVMVS